MPDLLHIDGLTFIGEARIAGDDEEPADAGERVMISSTMPSAKYSCSGSSLILANGNTAIDGLSGRARPELGRADTEPVAVTTRYVRTGRAMFLSTCSPMSSKARSRRPKASSCTRA